MPSKGMLYTTTSGYDILIRNCPHLILERAAQGIPVPEVPSFWNESKKESQENPNDPAYMAALMTHNTLRELAMIDAMISFSVIVQDAKRPSKRDVVKELKEMDVAIGGGLLDGYDLDSERDLDILWKKYFVLGAAVDLNAVQLHAMVQWEAVRESLKSFRTPEERSEG